MINLLLHVHLWNDYQKKLSGTPQRKKYMLELWQIFIHVYYMDLKVEIFKVRYYDYICNFHKETGGDSILASAFTGIEAEREGFGSNSHLLFLQTWDFSKRKKTHTPPQISEFCLVQTLNAHLTREKSMGKIFSLSHRYWKHG